MEMNSVLLCFVPYKKERQIRKEENKAEVKS